MIKLNSYYYDYKMLSPLTISFHTWDFMENLIVEMKYQNFTGLGESAPFKLITNDSREEAVKELKKLQRLNLNPEVDSLAELHQLLDSKSIQSPSLRAAIDFAYHDILGQVKGVPCYQLYSEHAYTVPNSVTVFIKKNEEETINEAIRIISLYPDLKVMKIKLSGKDDVERCSAIRHAVNKDIAYVLDANQGFDDPEESVHTLNKIIKILGKVILIEQPCPKDDLSKMKHVKDNIKGSMIFADESATDIKSVEKIIHEQAADGVNIKLQKCGGIYPAKKIADLCCQAGLKIMTGQMIEGPIATTASVHFAVSTQNMVITDLDMDLDLEKHINNSADFKNGLRIPKNTPGFGLSFNKAEIKHLQDKGILRLSKVC